MEKPAFQTRLTSPLALRSVAARSTTGAGTLGGDREHGGAQCRPRRAGPRPSSVVLVQRVVGVELLRLRHRVVPWSLGRGAGRAVAAAVEPFGEAALQFARDARVQVAAAGQLVEQLRGDDLRQRARGARRTAPGGAPAARASCRGRRRGRSARPASTRGSRRDAVGQQGRDRRGVGGGGDAVGHRVRQAGAARHRRGGGRAAACSASSASRSSGVSSGDSRITGSHTGSAHVVRKPQDQLARRLRHVLHHVGDGRAHPRRPRPPPAPTACSAPATCSRSRASCDRLWDQRGELACQQGAHPLVARRRPAARSHLSGADGFIATAARTVTAGSPASASSVPASVSALAASRTRERLTRFGAVADAVRAESSRGRLIAGASGCRETRQWPRPARLTSYIA